MNADMKRRLFLKQSLAASAMGILVSSGLLMPKAVLAAWPAEAFQSDDAQQALKAMFGTNELGDSPKVELTAPELAENGAGVPIKVNALMENVESITIVAVNNPRPLIASFNIGEGTLPFVATRIKMGESGEVIGIVKAAGKLYSAKQKVKVSVGGCS